MGWGTAQGGAGGSGEERGSPAAIAQCNTQRRHAHTCTITAHINTLFSFLSPPPHAHQTQALVPLSHAHNCSHVCSLAFPPGPVHCHVNMCVLLSPVQSVSHLFLSQVPQAPRKVNSKTRAWSGPKKNWAASAPKLNTKIATVVALRTTL